MAIVTDNSDAQTYLSGMGKKIKPLAEALHASLISLGCESYVKTIYVGYNIDGEPLTDGYRILFTADTDPLVKNKIYEVQKIVW